MKNFTQSIIILAALCLLGTFLTPQLSAQKAIGGTTPDPSALVDVKNTGGGVLLPRMTTAERNAIVQPATGLLIFNTTLNCMEMNFGASDWPAWGCLSVFTNNVTAASSSPTLCVNTPLTPVTHTTTGATGIGAPTGLPPGVSAAWSSNTITISGMPTATGTFDYTIPLTGGSGSGSATGTITVTFELAVGAASSTPTLCANTTLTAVTHTTTGATGIGAATGLPPGVSAAWSSNTITISGTPTAGGTFNYTIPLTGGCGSASATGTITVTPVNTAGAASSTPTLCVNTALTAITHISTGATGIGTATGLPAGVSASWASNTITISGTPTASGTFNYSIPLTGGCAGGSATGTIHVTPINTAGVASSTPTLCVNTALTPITRTTTGATGIGTATGLPAGVSASWASNTITISGTPTAGGTFNYSIPLTGGCGSVNATGTITVSPLNSAGTASSNPTLCINTSLTPITRTTTGATGIGTATGLPAGVSASWASNTITISGTPTASGTFNYSIPLTGGCGTVNATGSITVNPNRTAGTASSNPTLCISTALTPITRTTTGATGIGTPTGLPSGVTASWNSNTLTVSGTPSSSGTFNYTIPLTGGCGTANATGSITVNPNRTAGSPSSNPTLCINTALTPITRTTTGATGIGTPSGLPAGVTASWSANTLTVSGTPTASGTFNYTIPLTGGCGTANATGTITVNAVNTAGTPSSTPTLCQSTPLTAITHSTTGATGIGTATGLPSGVTAAWASNTITISGTPSVAGTFNYSIPLTGGCGTASATGTITTRSRTTGLTGCQVCGVGRIMTFSCYNLGAVATTDPYTPRWELNGNYYQWGRNTNITSGSPRYGAAGPTGSGSTQTNQAVVTGWSTTIAASGAWTDGSRGASDPCPAGFRVPTNAEWEAVINTSLNPTRSWPGTWSPAPPPIDPNSYTNYSAGLRIGSGSTGLFLPAAGFRISTDGTLFNRGVGGRYWSTTRTSNDAALLSFANNGVAVPSFPIGQGYSVRCIAQ